MTQKRSWHLPAAVGLTGLLALMSLSGWIRSYWVTDRLSFTHWEDRIRHEWLAQSEYGWLRVRCFTAYPPWTNVWAIPDSGWHYSADSPMVTPPQWHGLLGAAGASVWYAAGFGYASGAAVGTHPYRFIVIPYWAVAVATLVPFGLCARAYLKARRIQERAMRGLCLRCGYDLRATGDRCPECGTVPAREQPVSAPGPDRGASAEE
jgi:hypothetical protein